MHPPTQQLCNAILTTASTALDLPFREHRFARWTAAGVLLAVVISAWRPDEVDDWFMENSLVFVFAAVLAVTYRRLPLSDTSYTLIFVFLASHEWGAHYKYSDVPLGEWIKPWLHTSRNDYDRIMHFSYGLLLTYPLQEFTMRKLNVHSWWRYVIPVKAIVSFSAIYEMLEAFMASILSPQRGEEFVGMQGDIWDSQKDMFMATLGAVAAMVVVAAVRKLRAEAPQPASIRTAAAGSRAD